MNRPSIVIYPEAVEQRLSALEAENRAWTERALGAEQRLARAAQLYAAVAELHQAKTAEDVVTVVLEIVANLLGSEEMGVYERSGSGAEYACVSGIGLAADHLDLLPAEHSAVAEAMGTGRVVVTTDPRAERLRGRPVSAVVPFLEAGEVVALVVVYQLLRQKPALEDADRDLLEALGVHGALALTNSRLRDGAR